jgi:hypothetical protein
MILGLGYVMVTWIAGQFMQWILSKWFLGLDLSGGLKGAGKRIGYLERALILTFILINFPIGVGFLITAKSILRISGPRTSKDSNERELSEYILAGTLLSFLLAIVISIGVLAVLSAYIFD